MSSEKKPKSLKVFEETLWGFNLGIRKEGLPQRIVAGDGKAVKRKHKKKKKKADRPSEKISTRDGKKKKNGKTLFRMVLGEDGPTPGGQSFDGRVKGLKKTIRGDQKLETGGGFFTRGGSPVVPYSNKSDLEDV